MACHRREAEELLNYDVIAEVDAQPHTFEVLVARGKIGDDCMPYATFRDPDDLIIFEHDHRPITEILRRVTAAHKQEPVVLPASTIVRQ